jgi:hypothetical protein
MVSRVKFRRVFRSNPLHISEFSFFSQLFLIINLKFLPEIMLYLLSCGLAVAVTNV